MPSLRACTRDQARAESAKSALAMETPLALHFLRICFVCSGEKGTVGTIVLRFGLFFLGNAWPPCSVMKLQFWLNSLGKGGMHAR